MAWGYEKCFTVEHDPTVKKKIDCKDCIYYEKSDKSCGKRPLYLPEDGYNSWKTCSFFELDNSTSNYEVKLKQLKEMGKLSKSDDYILPSSKESKKNPKEDKVKFKVLSRIGKYVIVVPIDCINVPNKFKRKVPGKKKTDEVEIFYNTYKELDKPVLVSSIDGIYSVVDGYTRLYTAKKMGLDSIPVLLNNNTGKKREKLCKKNLKIKHTTYGMGTVIRFDLRCLEVKFEGKTEVIKLSLDYCAENDVISFVE